MDALLLVVAVGAALLLAYFTYGRWVAGRIFQLREDAATPATSLCDDKDYCPTPKTIVFGHHFTSIAGTGPIVGPAIAVMWGWLPAILWVVLGSVFIGAVHDLGALVVSLRNRGRSVGDIAGDLLGPRVRFIFLGVLVLALWIVLAIFGLVIAAVLRDYPAAIFPVLVQIPLAVTIGLLFHRKGRSILIPSAIALAVMYATVLWGDWGPLHTFNTFLASQPMWLWVSGLLVYAYIASVLPVWTLLQPRDYINSLQLISALGLLVAGLVVAAAIGGAPVEKPALSEAKRRIEHSDATVRTVSANAPLPPGEVSEGWRRTAEGSATEHRAANVALSPTRASHATRPRLEIVAPMFNLQPKGAPPLLPVLFITIACGAVSGFHCLVGSGTTSKQLARETDARAVGYGSMVTEAFLATLVIAACVAGIGLGVTKSLDTGAAATAGAQTASDTAAAQTAGNATPIDAESNTYLLSGRIAWNKQYESWATAGSLGAKVGAFVDGAANFIKAMGVPAGAAVALMGVLVASFAATTMDTACRLQRYVIQELGRTFLPKPPKRSCRFCGYDLSGTLAVQHCPECGGEDPHDRSGEAAPRAAASSLNPGRWLVSKHGATIFAVVTAAALAAMPAPGQAWTLANAGNGGLILWPLFGATNQLLGGLAFLVIGAWLIASKRPWWFMSVPAAFMLVVPAWALAWQAFIGNEDNASWIARENWLLVSVAVVTLALEAWLVLEVIARAWLANRAHPAAQPA